MEMPAGFKYWKSEANEVTSEFFDFTAEHYKMAEALEEKILPLMKEMAEALEHACGIIESEFGSLSEDVKTGLDDWGISKPFMALTKFREWRK